MSDEDDVEMLVPKKKAKGDRFEHYQFEVCMLMHEDREVEMSCYRAVVILP